METDVDPSLTGKKPRTCVKSALNRSSCCCLLPPSNHTHRHSSLSVELQFRLLPFLLMASTTGGRIPKELQDVFLASNRGEEVNEPPKDGSAFKVFKKKVFTFKGLRSRFQKMRRKNRLGGAEATLATEDVTNNDECARSRTSSKGDSIPNKPRRRVDSPPIKPRRPDTPQQFIESLVAARGYPTKRYGALSSAHFNRPTPYQLACYHARIIDTIIKHQDDQKLHELLDCGLSPNACNIHGESLLQTTCRMGYHRLLKVFVLHGATLTLADSQGRTLLHDTCWGSKPSLKIFDMLVQRHPHLIFMTDSRGACPLEYVNKNHHKVWIEHIEQVADRYWPHSEPVTLPSIVTGEPHSNPVPDPEHALSLELASMVIAGSISPQEATELREEVESTSYYDDEDEEEWSYDDKIPSVTFQSGYSTLSGSEDDDDWLMCHHNDGVPNGDSGIAVEVDSGFDYDDEHDDDTISSHDDDKFLRKGQLHHHCQRAIRKQDQNRPQPNRISPSTTPVESDSSDEYEGDNIRYDENHSASKTNDEDETDEEYHDASESHDFSQHVHECPPVGRPITLGSGAMRGEQF